MKNPFARSEINLEVLNALKDSKSQDKYIVQITAMQVLERLTWAFLIATLGPLISLLIGE